MTHEVTWSEDNGIAVIEAGGLTEPRNRALLLKAVRNAEAGAHIRALVVIVPSCTDAEHADLPNLKEMDEAPRLKDVVDAIASASKPIVAALVGNAFDGDLEIALACNHRIASEDALLGFPNVKIGMMPNARGTQMLPRLIGVQRALDIIALGEPIGARTACDIGLVDAIAEGDLVGVASAVARQLVGAPQRRTQDLIVSSFDAAVFDEFARRHSRKLRGLDAPKAILTAIKAAADLPFDKGAQQECACFEKLMAGTQHFALRYAANAGNEAAKILELEGEVPRPISSVGVVGSGTMGSGIAIALLCSGLRVTLFEKDASALDRGAAHIRKTIGANLAAGRITEAEANFALAGLSPVSEIAQLAHVDLVIEAAYETMEVKREIFSALHRVVRPGAILATNTSYLDIDEIALASGRPADVIGLHFFSPANIMKLLEIVRGGATSPDVIATAFSLARKIGKIAVLSRNAWGFIGNRMLAVCRDHAEAMAIEGAPPAQIDAVMEQFGLAMGPFRVGDLAGLDLGWNPQTSTGATIRERLCEAGRRGQKSGAGFYDYDANRQAVPSNVALEIISGFARDQGITQRGFTDTEVLDRLLWPMVDEGAKILAEGIVLRESDIDVVWLNGYGWPAWTGGPMFYARQVGLDEVVQRIENLGLIPSDAMIAMADADQSCKGSQLEHVARL